jgi:hypothetical protein
MDDAVVLTDTARGLPRKGQPFCMSGCVIAVDRRDRMVLINNTHITLGGLDMHRCHWIGLLTVLIGLILVAESAVAGRFSLSVGYGAKRIDGTSSDDDGDFDITAPAVSGIRVEGAG